MGRASCGATALLSLGIVDMLGRVYAGFRVGACQHGSHVTAAALCSGVASCLVYLRNVST